METESFPLINKAHHGRNIKRVREILGVKQEVLAEQLNMSQQTVSRFESKEELEDEIIDKIAKVLNVPIDTIKRFNEEGVINIISSTLHDNAGSIINSPSFNPLDKVVELYERMLKAEQEKVALLEQLLRERKE